VLLIKLFISADMSRAVTCGGLLIALLAVAASIQIPKMLPAFDFWPPTADPSKTMSAIVYKEHGDPSVLQYDTRHPQPLPKASQYLIQVAASALNPVDFKQRRNPLIPRFVIPFPKIPGGDIAGVVVHVPTDGKAHKYNVGDRVAALMPYYGAKWGALSDYAAVEERFLAKLGDSTDFTSAASYCLVGLTVLQNFENVQGIHLKENKLLVHAGAGGVGTFAIQWAKKILGMHVTTTASGPKADLLKDLGADKVIDYRTEDFDQVLKDYDVVLDPMSWLYEERSLKVLKPTGHYLNVPSSDWGFEDGVEKINGVSTGINFIISKLRNLFQPGKAPKYGLVMVEPNGEQLQLILDAMESGKIRPVIDRIYHLSQAAEAYRYLEEGHVTGKVVLYHGDKKADEVVKDAAEATNDATQVAEDEVATQFEAAEELEQEDMKSVVEDEPRQDIVAAETNEEDGSQSKGQKDAQEPAEGEEVVDKEAQEYST
jgi:alcohol dehydrogenase